MTVQSAGSGCALAVANPWGMVPALGNLDAYISAVNRLPMLTLEQEQSFARKFRDHNDLEAAGKLVLSHLRLVVSVSRQYLGYGLPHSDLIQEGNVGLMKAVKRFDPEQGVRLVSYALHWIKAEIHEYVLKNWRMVKVATTKAQRKLFFNLRSMKQRFKSEDAAADVGTHRDTLNESQIDAMARELKVKREEVIEMETRLSGGDVLLDPSPSDDGEDAFGPQHETRTMRMRNEKSLSCRRRVRIQPNAAVERKLNEPTADFHPHSSAQNASMLTPACAIRPASVPGFIGRCIGTTTVRCSLRRMTCEPVYRRSANPRRRSARTACAPLTSRGSFTPPPVPDPE